MSIVGDTDQSQMMNQFQNDMNSLDVHGMRMLRTLVIEYIKSDYNRVLVEGKYESLFRRHFTQPVLTQPARIWQRYIGSSIENMLVGRFIQ